MDLKFRLKPNDTNRKTADQRYFQTQNTKTVNNAEGWDKYARKTQPASSAQQPKPVQTTGVKSTGKVSPSIKSNINRYYRSDAAPKTQYKLFLSDSNNVFYEERQSLKLLNLYRNFKFFSAIGLILFFVVYLALHFIKPFEGECPTNAECGVFVHCYDGFTYDKQKNQCIISQSLYRQIEDVCTSRIIKAREQWANQQCNGQQEIIPRINLEQLLIGIDNFEIKDQLRRRMQTFLSSQQNQQNLHFEYSRRTIIPTQKKYSLTCNLTKLIHSNNFKFGFPLFIFLLLLTSLAILQIRRRIIAKKIYDQLRKRTIAQKMLNISYAKADLQKQFGSIDEKMWELIDANRTKDRDIGFLQDDFLYWKML